MQYSPLSFSWRFIPFITRQLKRYPPLFDISRRVSRAAGWSGPVDSALGSLIGGRTDLRFIQIGANDGISNDPVREFVIARPRWQGVLVEPLPELLALCRRNYSHYSLSNLAFVNAAVSDRQGQLQIWKIKDQCRAAFGPLARQVASTDPNHLLKHFPRLNLDIDAEQVSVDCLTYSGLLNKVGFESLDLPLVDAEGHEPAVLRPLSSALVLPSVILFENSHLSPADEEEILALLNSLGYTTRSLGMDSLATRDAVIDPERLAFHASPEETAHCRA